MKYPVAPAPGSVLSVPPRSKTLESSEDFLKLTPIPSFELANQVSQPLNSYFNVVFLEVSYELDGDSFA